MRFIPLSLRRTARTPHSTGFARLELGLFTKPSVMMNFYESISVKDQHDFWVRWLELWLLDPFDTIWAAII